MKVSEILLPEFDIEISSTRKLLERVPVNKPDWKPHVKSMPLGRLAGHLADLPAFAVSIMNEDSLDLTARLKGGYQPFIASSTDELLDRFDKNAAEARKAVAAASEQHFAKIWAMQLEGKTIVSMPRWSVIQSCLNHIVHHRAQLGVYLRLNDIPLPALYGPSADENM